MPHGGPHQKTTFSSNRPKTDTRPKGMPSFLSSSEPKKSFSQMTSQERTDRFNKNQDKYKQEFKKKVGPIRTPEIPDGSKPKTTEQQSRDDRKLYRQYQDPKTLYKTFNKTY